MAWRPKSASISWTMSFWRSVWSPFFWPPRKRRPRPSDPSGRQPNPGTHPNRYRRVGETRARPQSVAGLRRTARQKGIANESYPLPPKSRCSRGRAGHPDHLRRRSPPCCTWSCVREPCRDGWVEVEPTRWQVEGHGAGFRKGEVSYLNLTAVDAVRQGTKNGSFHISPIL